MVKQSPFAGYNEPTQEERVRATFGVSGWSTILYLWTHTVWFMYTNRKKEYNIWSPFVFDAQMKTNEVWLKQYKLLKDSDGSQEDYSRYAKDFVEAISASNTKKGMVADMFRQAKEDHIRIACQICNMTKPGEREGTRLVITKGTELLDSIRDDCSYDNLRKLCWVVYSSTTKSYENVFGMKMNEYYEKQFMEKNKIMYLRPVGMDGKEYITKGCISRHMNRILNQVRCSIRDGMVLATNCAIGNVSSSGPKGQTLVKNTPDIFWFGRKFSGPENQKKMTEEQKKKQKLAWEYVSFVFLIVEIENHTKAHLIQ
jgi:hypothetical protein